MTIKQLYKLYQEHPCITTDSRDCPPGSIFLALKGESFDGNQFALQALEKGCAYAIVDKSVECRVESVEFATAIPSGEGTAEDKAVANSTAIPSDEDKAVANSTLYTLHSKLIKVDDTLQTFKDLAREHRRQFHIPVIGITGTNGKTTTKELIAAVLSKKYNVLYTQGNFNNDVGVPKTLFRLNADHDIAVIEMGASHPGDIKTLAETAEPTCGLITNVGRAHLQGFGSFKNVVKTKGELYDYLSRRGESLVFLNADNERLVDILPDNVWVAPYSTNPDNVEGCTVGQVVSCAPFLKFRWRESDTNLEEAAKATGDLSKTTGELSKTTETTGTTGETSATTEPVWYEVQTQLIGAYNIDNMMAAIAVGLNFGVEPALINAALEAYKPSNNRSQLTVTAHNHLVVDAYNANPSSMRAALDNFRLMDVKPKMVILGEMRELGNSSRKEHQKLLAQLAESNIDEVWLVGDEYTDLPATYRHFHDVDEVKAAIQAQQPQGYYILIKGSNSTRLYQLPEML